MNSQLAKIAKHLQMKPIIDEVGRQIYRAVASSDYHLLDPFIMLDTGFMKYPNGFSDHPHRGFQAVAYIREGVMQHEDFFGNTKPNYAGDVAWINTGKGIMHAEMPADVPERVHAFQLWLNLPSHLKLSEPQYAVYPNSSIPVVEQEGVRAKVISGTGFGITGPAKSPNNIQYFDITINGKKTVGLTLNPNWSAFLFCINGKAVVNGQDLEGGWSIIFERSQDAQKVSIQASSDKVELIWLSAVPLGEPIVHKGPFVMNTQEEIDQAYEDFEKMQNGFEHRANFSSKIKATVEANKNKH